MLPLDRFAPVGGLEATLRFRARSEGAGARRTLRIEFSELEDESPSIPYTKRVSILFNAHTPT